MLAIGTNEEKIPEFLNALKEAVNKDDKEQVANFMHYPLIWNSSKRSKALFITRENFLYHYDEIITPKLKQTVNEARMNNITSQYGRLVIGSGEIWFTGRSETNSPIASISDMGPDIYFKREIKK